MQCSQHTLSLSLALPLLVCASQFFFAQNVFVAGVDVAVSVSVAAALQIVCNFYGAWLGTFARGSGQEGRRKGEWVMGAAFMNKRFSSVLRPHAVSLARTPAPCFTSLYPLSSPSSACHGTARRFPSIYYAFGLAGRK